MKLEDVHLQIDGLGDDLVKNYRWILFALLKVGGLDGVKRGQTVIHFNAEGKFQKVQLNYFPWVDKNSND